MQGVHTAGKLALLGVAFALTVAVAGGAAFQAPRPGADLVPIRGAGDVIDILQGNETILWTSLSGSVGSYRVTGWPSVSGGGELGGALVMERPEDGLAGAIEFGEKPRSLVFDLDG